MLKPIEESIHILKQLNYKIQHSIETITEKCVEYNIDEISAQSMFYYVMDLGLILSVSYLDELNKYFFKAIKIEKGDLYAKNFMNVLKIPKKEIEHRFPDLKTFRNNYLAHNMRIDNQNYKSVVLHGDLRRYRIPQNPHDYIFLTNCINQINITINHIFPGAFEVAELYRIDSVKNLPLLNPQFYNIESVQTETKKLSELINKSFQDLELKLNL